MGRFRLTLVLVTLICAAAASAAQQSVPNDNETMGVGRSQDYPPGDARHCFETAKKNGYTMQRFQVLPVFGWDNLRNLDQGQVFSLNYSTCRTTPDGHFLLPNGVSALPIKASYVNSFAELIMQWKNWKSSTSKAINTRVGLGLALDLGFVGINGKFSSEFQDIKSKQIKDKSLTIRAQIRYVRYQVQLQADTPPDPAFQKRVLGIAVASQLGQRVRAQYLAQQLVRDFGTHVVSRVHAGAALLQVDQLREDWVMSKKVNKTYIRAAASVSLFSSIELGISASFKTKVDEQFMAEYRKHRTSSSIVTKGGPPLLPGNFTRDQWAVEVDANLVALDRDGDPLYHLIKWALLPELPQSILKEVRDRVKEAVEAYYRFNIHPGCTNPSSPNFSPLSNVDNGSCTSSTKFGGVYQTCIINTLPPVACPQAPVQKNPLTGKLSCPDEYEPVKLYTKWTLNKLIRFDTYWCFANGVSALPGYLFGGLYTPASDNVVTHSKTCPPTFFPVKMMADTGLNVCVSDNVALGEKHSVPFGGFLSCQTGNPLAVSPHNGDTQQAKEWPKKCLEGYARHMALVVDHCQINYCVGIKSLLDPILAPIKRPPFIPAPPPPSPSKDNLKVFDPRTNTWRKSQSPVDTREGLLETAAADNVSSDSRSSSDEGPSTSSLLPPGVEAAIALGVTAVCLLLVVLVVLAVKATRKRRPGRGGKVHDDHPEAHVAVQETLLD